MRNIDGRSEGFWSGELTLQVMPTPDALAKALRRKIKAEYKEAFGTNVSYTIGDVEEILNEIISVLEKM
jgi:hypothetical protein